MGIVLACVLFIYVRSKPRNHKKRIVYKNKTKIMSIFYFITLSALVIGLYTSNERTLSNFIFIFIMYVLTYYAYIYSKSISISLFYLLLTKASLTYSVILNYELYYGFSDTLAHLTFAHIIQDTGDLLPGAVSGSYQAFPLYHIFNIMSSEILGVEMRTALFIVFGFAYSASFIFIFCTCKRFFSSLHCLIISIVYSSLPSSIFYGYYPVTRTMAFIGFLIILMTVFLKSRLEQRFLFLFVIISIYVISVHAVSMPFIIFIMALAATICMYYIFIDETNNMNNVPRATIGLGILFIFYWVFVSERILHSLARRTSAPVTSADGSVNIEESIDVMANIFISINSSIIALTLLFGVLSMLVFSKNRSVHVLAMCSLALAPLFLPSPLHLIPVFSDILVWDRFALYSLAIVPIPIGYAIAVMRSYNIRVSNIILILLIFSSLIVPMSAHDSPDMPYEEHNRYFDEMETTSFSFINFYVPANSNLSTDHHAAKYFNTYSDISESDRITYFNYKFISPVDSSQDELYRLFRLSGSQRDNLEYNTLEGRFYVTDNNVHEAIIIHKSENKIYSNDGAILTN